MSMEQTVDFSVKLISIHSDSRSVPESEFAQLVQMSLAGEELIKLVKIEPNSNSLVLGEVKY